MAELRVYLKFPNESEGVLFKMRKTMK